MKILNGAENSMNKTKVLSVQLGKTLSFVKFVGEWGGGGNFGFYFIDLKEANIPNLAMPRTLLKVFGGGWWF